MGAGGTALLGRQSPVGGRESRGASVRQVFEGGGNYGGCSGQEEDR